MSEQNKSFEADGTRPIESGEIEVADTFEEDGTRPIGESPDYLVRENSDRQESNSQNSERVLKIDGKGPVNNSDVKVVDTFEADGERPIMSNKYEVVDTLDVDGERPITSS